MEALEFTVVDAFTETAFGGNPAAVVVLNKDHGLPDKFCQLFAREMAHAETAFTYEIAPGRFSIRWFTPLVEVDLCGHATLAAAHALFERNPGLESIVFETKVSGELTAKKNGDFIELVFPSSPPTADKAPAGLFAACGLTDSDVVYFGNNNMDWTIVIEGGAAAIKAVAPNITMLEQFKTRCVHITSAADGAEREMGIDFVSRVFGPAVGIPEDPVTGSAHCALAPYWAGKLGKTVVQGYQASARGGHLTCTVNKENVTLSGRAVTVTKGQLVPRPTDLIQKLQL